MSRKKGGGKRGCMNGTIVHFVPANSRALRRPGRPTNVLAPPQNSWITRHRASRHRCSGRLIFRDSLDQATDILVQRRRQLHQVSALLQHFEFVHGLLPPKDHASGDQPGAPGPPPRRRCFCFPVCAVLLICFSVGVSVPPSLLQTVFANTCFDVAVRHAGEVQHIA
jgi:hypothetical protein